MGLSGSSAYVLKPVAAERVSVTALAFSTVSLSPLTVTLPPSALASSRAAKCIPFPSASSQGMGFGVRQ